MGYFSCLGPLLEEPWLSGSCSKTPVSMPHRPSIMHDASPSSLALSSSYAVALSPLRASPSCCQEPQTLSCTAPLHSSTPENETCQGMLTPSHTHVVQQPTSSFSASHAFLVMRASVFSPPLLLACETPVPHSAQIPTKNCAYHQATGNTRHRFHHHLSRDQNLH